MNDTVNALPLPLLVTAIIAVTAAMVAYALHTHGRCPEWAGNGLLLVAVFCLALAMGVAA